MEEQKYTLLELEAMKWLRETDAMQFDQWELLAMFARHCLALPKETILDEDVKGIVGINETRQVISQVKESSNTGWIEKMYLEIESQHPYKRSGNPESHSKYNEGWSDACCEFESKLEEHFRNTNK